jgi:predicted CopG family antitoxin
MEGRMLLKKARSTLDLVATGTRSQKEVFKLLDKMRKEDERWKAGVL